MITDKDAQKLLERFSEVFATKAELNAETISIRLELRQEVTKIREEMVTKREFRKLFGMVEGLATNIKKMNEEWAMHFGKHDRIDNQLDSHEKRIIKLEVSPVSS